MCGEMEGAAEGAMMLPMTVDILYVVRKAEIQLVVSFMWNVCINSLVGLSDQELLGPPGDEKNSP